MRSEILLTALLAACAKDDAPTEADPARVTCPATPDPRTADLFARLDAERQELGAPGRAVAVLADGEVIGCAGFGVAFSGGPAVDAHTGFRIGSQTKSLTAAGLLKLVDEGEVDLDAPVDALLPGWDMRSNPGAGAQITPRMLLSHQGGFVDYLAIDDSLPLARFVSDQLPRLYLMATPGSFFNYANPNYYMAGALIEQVTGERYPDWMEAVVLPGLGLTETVFDAARLPDHTFATGLGADWQTGSADLVDQDPDAYDNPWARPAGYAWSTAEDLARLADAVLNGQALLSGAQAEAWTTPQVNTYELGDTSHYALGWFVQDGHYDGGDDWWDQRLVLHGGDIPGFAADVVLAPDDGFGIIVLTSRDGAHLGADTMVEALRTFAPREPSTPPPVAFDAAALPSYAGTYNDPWNVGDMIFTVEGDTLRLSMPEVDAANVPYEPLLTPTSADNFVVVVQDTPLGLTFVRDDGGAIRWARTRAFVGERE